jgi:hypothetical protein
LIDHRRQFATPSETRQDWVGLGPLSVAALPNWGADLGDDCCAALRCAALPCPALMNAGGYSTHWFRGRSKG